MVKYIQKATREVISISRAGLPHPARALTIQMACFSASSYHVNTISQFYSDDSSD